MSQTRTRRVTQKSAQYDTTEDEQIIPATRQVPPGAIDLLTPRTNARMRQYQDDTLLEENEELIDEPWPSRLPTSTRRYNNTPMQKAQPLPPGEYLINGKRVIVEAPQVIQRRKPQAASGYNEYAGEAPVPKRHGSHWMFILGIGMVIALCAWFGLTQLLNWWTLRQQDATFGRPRTYQFDARLPGDGQLPTHFIFINLNRHVTIYQEPGGDATKTIVYNGPTLFGDGEDLTPVLGRVALVNKQIALILYIQDQRLVYFLSGNKFVPATAQQNATINTNKLPPPPNP